MSCDWITTEAFARNLDGFMTLFDRSNAELGSHIGVSREIVRQWRNGDCMPSANNLTNIYGFFGDFSLLPDFIKPYCTANLIQILTKHGLDAEALKRMNLCPPDRIMRYVDISRIVEYIRIRHSVRYSVKEILGTLPLRQWAKRENIPLTRAKALFASRVLLGAIETSHGLLIPNEIVAPEDSKRLATLAKNRPQFGVHSLETFHVLFNDIMNIQGINNNELADYLEVDAVSVSHWRRGDRVPSEAIMQKIADFCNCDVSDLLLEEEDA